MSFLNQTNFLNQQTPQILPYTFTTGELDTLKTKLSQAENTMLNSPQKLSQTVIQLSLGEIRSLQRMIDMTYLQGMSGLNSLPVQPEISQQLIQSNQKSNFISLGGPGPNYTCHKCGKKGHYVHDCPHVQGRGVPPPNYTCHKCNQKGHWIQDCPSHSQSDYNKPPPNNYTCHRCHRPGHWIKNCPTNNNPQYDKNNINNNNNNNNSSNNSSNNNNNNNSNTNELINTTQLTNSNDSSLIGKKRSFGEI